VRRIEELAPQLLALSLDAGCALVLGTAREARGVGLLARAPRSAEASAFLLALRARLIDATLEDATQHGAALLLRFTALSGRVALACVFDGHAGAFALVDSEGRVIATSDSRALASDTRFVPPHAHGELVLADTLDALEATGARLLAASAAAEFDARRRTLSRAVRRAIDKVARRLAAIDEDLRGAAESDTLRRHGSLLLAAAHGTPRDATELQILDESETPARPLVQPLQPQPGGETGPRAVVAAAETLFARARKRETAARIGAERRADTARVFRELDLLSARIAEATDESALRAYADAARALGVRGAHAALTPRATAPGKRRRADVPQRLPYRRFSSANGRPLLVGRGAHDNDALTFQHARPGDRWLHARGLPGAHVVVPLTRGETCPDPLLLDAATLAAHFSDARGERVVEIQHAERRHVRKPRGAPPGAVVVERERVLVLRLEPDRLARLLRSETLAEGDARPPPSGARHK
jgi:predicted ribosome quality control (RQC) complex YloA/Tae2 family protein